MSTPLRKEFRYAASAEHVWKALTATDKLKIWYFPQLQKFEALVGFKFQCDQAGADYQKEWLVTKVTEGKHSHIAGLTKAIPEFQK